MGRNVFRPGEAQDLRGNGLSVFEFSVYLGSGFLRVAGSNLPDNEVNREMLQRRLKRAGFTLDCAADGQEALDKMRALRPALVLLDIDLPVKDGWTVAKEASADPQI